MTTYRQADGKPIYNEFDFVLHEEFWEGCGEPTEVIQEKWVRVASTERQFGIPWNAK